MSLPYDEPYTSIKSKFIKQEIKKTRWKNREYIDCLGTIEHLALGGGLGFGTGHAYMNLPRMYPKQWKIIWNELNPKGHKRLTNCARGEREKERREKEKFEREEKEQAKREHLSWKKIGGKL